MAGSAALLAYAAPRASATQIRNALVLGANTKILDDRSNVVDQGSGYLDVANALKLVQRHQVSNKLPSFPFQTGEVGLNVLRFGIVPIPVFAGMPLNLKATNLLPGQKKEFLLYIGKDIGNVQIQLTGVNPQLAPDKQNQLFGDDIIFAVHQAKTSAHGEGDYPVFSFVNGPASFSIDGPEPGYMRVAVVGDYTNAGKVAATLTIHATKQSTANFSQSHTISEGEQQVIPFTMPAGVSKATFELTWNNDWSHYPTNDLDLILVDPDGNAIFDGATLNGRETATITNPKAGTWTMVVDGFNIYGTLHNDGTETGPQKDTYRLRVFEQ